jgi:hypothetical protein
MLGIEGGPRLLLFAFVCIMTWITDRLPTEADGDMDGDVQIRRAPGTDLFRFLHWSYVGAGVPWQRTVFWQPPAEPAPTEADRIAALEQRVAADSDRIAALERRVFGLEVFKRALTEPSLIRHSVI